MWTAGKPKISCKLDLIKMFFNRNYDYGIMHKLNLINKFDYYYGNDSKPCYYSQIFDELGIIPDDKNVYYGYLSKLKEIFDLSCNILEIGGGYIPSFSQKIALEQIKIGKGTITVCDPLLITKKSKYKNLHLSKKAFTHKTNISNYDLLVGIFPCSVTLLIIEKALKENKDFFIGLCGCIHNYNFDKKIYGYFVKYPDEFNRILIEYINDMVIKSGRSDIGVTYLSDSYNVSYPIIYSKKISM